MTDVVFIQGGGKCAHEADRSLADSLADALGDGFEVHFPKMPKASDPKADAWKRKIGAEIARLRGPVILVGHSIGGSILLRYLADERIDAPIAGVFLLAAPSWDPDRWNFDDLKLPADIGEKLAALPRVAFYHCRDDAVVPFAHLARHRQRVPTAAFRPLDQGGHSFGEDLSAVAAEIRGGV